MINMNLMLFVSHLLNPLKIVTIKWVKQSLKNIDLDELRYETLTFWQLLYILMISIIIVSWHSKQKDQSFVSNILLFSF